MVIRELDLYTLCIGKVSPVQDVGWKWLCISTMLRYPYVKSQRNIHFPSNKRYYFLVVCEFLSTYSHTAMKVSNVKIESSDG